MPRKRTQPATNTSVPPASESANKKWAEPYRPIVTNPDAGFEMGENKLTRQMVFYFSQDPGAQVKERLKHYGYFYHAEQKAWAVNATPVTREIAQKLAVEIAGDKGRSR